MSIATTYSAQISGVHANIINIETDISNGLHTFSIVGLGDRSVDEAKDRVAAAIKNSGFVSPKQKNQKVVVSLAPADLRKEGSAFDLGVAISYLLAVGEIDFNTNKKIFLGELSLEGKLRPVNGILAMVIAAKEAHFEEIYLPKENAREAALISDIKIYPMASLTEVISHLIGTKKIEPQRNTSITKNLTTNKDVASFENIYGQENAKRALEIAVAGRHNVIMYGPPGTGKTMLAKALQNIIPGLSYTESIEVTSIHSIARILKEETVTHPPFRAPHHTSSYASLVGGGSMLHPGEITLAHKGILFMDEFPEFDRRVIDSLRQPLEEKKISIIRAKGTATYPADFMLVAAMNPCPCGNLHSNELIKKCICTDHEIMRYRKKISGPIADRIDLWIPVLKIDPRSLQKNTKTEASTDIQMRITKANQFRKREGLGPEKISKEISTLLARFSERLGLSGRGYYRTLSVARTIANLAASEEIKKEHLLEALQYRQREI